MLAIDLPLGGWSTLTYEDDMTNTKMLRHELWAAYVKVEKGQNMRFFLDRSGNWAVADNSGPTPEKTDDGPLWVDPSRPAVERADRLWVLPVTKHVGMPDNYNCVITFREAMFITSPR